ncbi:MAG: DUF6544 family protein [Flavobacteriaceae bacterium]
MRTILALIFLIHGVIHFMGFAKAYGFGQMTALTKAISKPLGWLWLLAGLLFIVAVIIYLMKRDTWAILTIITVVVSQFLIISVWNDAKFGTLGNVILLAAAVIGLATSHFENTYKKEVLNAIDKSTFNNGPVTEKDLERLPPVVQRYLRYVGALGKPKISNVKIVFEGEMRDKGQDWFKFTSEQYNFFDHPTRLFFMKAKIKGLPTHGYHSYKPDGAGMLIKLLSIFPVVEIQGEEMFPTETVTFFNDLCLFAPARLIDERISWESIDDFSAKATFTTGGAPISAVLSFNEKGQLINFISNDRFSVSEMKSYPFSTPAKDYEIVNGYHLATHGEAIWHYPDGEFVYGKFKLISITYNIEKME